MRASNMVFRFKRICTFASGPYLSNLITVTPCSDQQQETYNECPQSVTSNGKPVSNLPANMGEVKTATQRVKELLEKFRVKNMIPGISVAIAIQGGEPGVVYSGLQDIGSRLPVHHKTKMRWGNVSMSLTAFMSIKKAQSDQASLGMSKTVKDLLAGDFGNINQAQQVTFQQLITHRSGLRDFQPSETKWMGTKHTAGAEWNALSIMENCWAPGTNPGTFLYSRMGYHVLGRILIEDHNVGKGDDIPEPEAVFHSFFQSIGLRQTKVDDILAIRYFRSKQYALKKVDNNWVIRPCIYHDCSRYVGAEGYMGTCLDMARFGSRIAMLKSNEIKNILFDVSPQATKNINGKSYRQCAFGLVKADSNKEVNEVMSISCGESLGCSNVLYLRGLDKSKGEPTLCIAIMSNLEGVDDVYRKLLPDIIKVYDEIVFDSEMEQ